METLSMFNFVLDKKQPLSKVLISKGLRDFQSAIQYIHQLPYGRTSERSDYTLVIPEQTGTCATKHAFLQQIANENNQDAIALYIRIYAMNETNTKGVGVVLSEYKLNYIPEAHTYLKINGIIVDITRSTESSVSFQNSLLAEQKIKPQSIGGFKIQWHQKFIKQWLQTEKIDFSFEEVWNIREKCILALSK